MHHIAIDLGSKHSQLCIRNSNAEIVDERKITTGSIPRVLRKAPQPARLVLEACTEAFSVADSAREIGFDVRIVPATLVRTLGVGARGIKTDRRDAQILSEVSTRIELPTIHIPSVPSRDLKSAIKARDSLVASRTKLINSVRAFLRSRRIRVRSGARAFKDKVEAGSKERDLPDFIFAQLECISTINRQILDADNNLRKLALQNETTRRLMTIPGVGPICSLSFLCTVDDITRFSNAHALQSYLGVTPGEHSSSLKQRRTGITKAGPAFLRRYLTQAAWAVRLRHKNDPLAVWAENIATRRGTAKANIALVRKLAGVMFAVWRDGTVYQPTTS